MPSTLHLTIATWVVAAAAAAHATNNTPPWQAVPFTPVSYGVGATVTASNLKPYSGPINVQDPQSWVTIDYGAEVAGFPFVEVESVEGPVEIEIKSSEGLPFITAPYADGPWVFTSLLANGFRTDNFNITGPGRYESFLLQGGLRWQTLRLLGKGNVTFSQIGLRPSVEILPLRSLPGSFSSSKTAYTDIWGLGARSVQVACVEKGTQPSTWELSSQGVFVRAQQPLYSAKGVNFSNYTLTFETNITKGGLVWRVAANNNFGAYFALTTHDYSGVPVENVAGAPDFPANSLIFGYGWSIVNQTTLTSGPVQFFGAPFQVTSGKWYQVKTNISDAGYQVFVDGQQVATVSYAEAEGIKSALQDGGPRDGSWAFGAFEGQSAYFRNAEVVAKNGTVLYRNSLTGADILDEYANAANRYSVCLDGGKRDRLVWTGDFAQAVRTVLTTTNRTDFIQGLLDYVFAFQLEQGPRAGQVPVSGLLGAAPIYKDAYSRSLYALTDYEIFVLLTIGHYYRATGDVASLRPLWPQIKILTDAVVAKINPTTGLVGVNKDVWYVSGFEQNATAVAALLSWSLQKLAPLARDLSYSTYAASLQSVALGLNTAVNSLWSDSLKTYSNSLLDPGNYSLTATAFPILSGAANSTQAIFAYAKLSSLFYKIGYKSYSTDVSADDLSLSPFFQGFLLEALFTGFKQLNVPTSSVVPIISNLLDNYWPHMLPYAPGRNEYYTGSTWEYVYANGTPGLGNGAFTSLNHPWGSAPTFVFTEYLLGISAVDAGYSTWGFEPVLGEELGLTWAEGKVPTPKGVILAKWSKDQKSNSTTLSVNAPAGTNGTLRLRGKKAIKVNGQTLGTSNDTVAVAGGHPTQVEFA